MTKIKKIIDQTDMLWLEGVFGKVTKWARKRDIDNAKAILEWPDGYCEIQK